MREITRKLVGLTTSLALAFGLAACGPAAQPDPTNAEELVARYEANENRDNYHGEGKLGMSISFLGMEMPMTGTMAIDTAGDNSYYVTDITGEMFGESVTTKSESYSTREDKVFAVYTRTTDENGEGEWTRGETDADSTLSSAMMSTESLKKAEFAATENGYTLTLNSADIDDLLNAVNVDTDDLVESLGKDFTATPSDDTKVVYTFDKDCMPTNVTFKIGYDFKYTGETNDIIDLSSMSMGVVVDLNMDFTGYGTVDAAKVTVPDDVKANAVAADADGFDISDALGNTEATEDAEATEDTEATEATEDKEATETSDAA